MKHMRNIRTGRLVVYDESLLATGRFEVYVEQAPRDEDEVSVADSVVVTIRRPSGESIRCEA